jgi:putative membrane protein
MWLMAAHIARAAAHHSPGERNAPAATGVRTLNRNAGKETIAPMEDRGSDRDELAEDRTDLAEDRTAMANERTFAGWARTAMAAIGIGLAFNALFNAMEPAWAPKAIATVFILLGIFLVFMAERRACAVSARLDTHAGKELSSMNVRVIAIAIAFGAACLIAGIWLLV